MAARLAFERQRRGLDAARGQSLALQFIADDEIALGERKLARTARPFKPVGAVAERYTGQRVGPPAGVELRSQRTDDLQARIAQRKAAAGAIERLQAERAVEFGRRSSHGELTERGQPLDLAIAQLQLWRNGREGAGKSAAQVARAFGFQANGSRRAVNPRAAVDQLEVEVGQPFGPAFVGKQHFVERAETDLATGDAAVKARTE